MRGEGLGPSPTLIVDKDEHGLGLGGDEDEEGEGCGGCLAAERCKIVHAIDFEEKFETVTSWNYQNGERLYQSVMSVIS